MSYLNIDEAYDYNTLACWYQRSIDETQPPIWTDEHLEELLKDFYIIPKDTSAADVVPKSEVAREIFEEIQKIFVNRILHNESQYFEGVLDNITKDLDELKKKYTEEKE